MNDTALDVLLSAHFVLSNPDNWCKGTTARNAKGLHVFMDSPDAVKWCLIGAIFSAAKCLTTYPITADNEAIRILRRHINNSFALYNDTHTHAEIIAVLEATINHEMSKLSKL